MATPKQKLVELKSEQDWLDEKGAKLAEVSCLGGWIFYVSLIFSGNFWAFFLVELDDVG